jgi:hypothetical protein
LNDRLREAWYAGLTFRYGSAIAYQLSKRTAASKRDTDVSARPTRVTPSAMLSSTTDRMPFDLAASFMEAAERELASSLPSSYANAMRTANGGELDVLNDDWRLYPIADSSDRRRLSRTSNHAIKETAALQQWPKFPSRALAIAGNGSGDQLLILRNGDDFGDAVHHWSHETGVLTKVADDFADLPRA